MNGNRPSDEELRGMTVNERLFACGMFSQWDAAVAACDKKQMIAVLRSVTLSETQARETTDAILNDPKKYGF